MHFKVRKMPFWPPSENVPQKSIKWSEKCRFGAFQCTFRVLSDIYLTFGGHFLGEGQIGIFRTLECTFWNSRISGSVWGRDDHNTRAKYQRPPRFGPPMFITVWGEWWADVGVLSASFFLCSPPYLLAGRVGTSLFPQSVRNASHGKSRNVGKNTKVPSLSTSLRMRSKH